MNSPTTRRDFLQIAAAGAAFAGFAGQPRAAANNRITIGMIGMGRQAFDYNLKSFLKSPDTQVVAVCDVDRWRLEKAVSDVETFYAEGKRSGSYKGCTSYKDFRQLLARQDIDAVMISTPDHWHVPMALLAVKAGKDICCEKPLIRSIAEGRTLSDAVTRHKRVFRTDSEFRSLPNFHGLCQLVRNGAVGKIQTIRVGVPFEPDNEAEYPPDEVMPVPEELDYELWLGPAPEVPYTEKRVHPRHSFGRPGWMRVRDYCDGMITNWGAHLNDIAQWAHNTERTGPVEIEGKGEYPAKGIWNVLLKFDVRFRFADGVEHLYRTERPYIRVEGEKGWIEAEWKDTLRAEPESLLKPSGPQKVRLVLKDEKQDFIDAVKTRGRTLEDAEVGHRTTSLGLLGQIAIEVGGALKWDPKRERFLNSDDANQRLTRTVRAPWAERTS